MSTMTRARPGPLKLLLRGVESLFVAAAVIVPVYFFVQARTPKGPPREPLAPALVYVLPRLHGSFQRLNWLDEGKHFPRLGEMNGNALTLRSYVQEWRAVYFLPAQTVRWTRYRVHVGVTGLGRPDSGTNATLIIGLQPHYTLTLSAGRLTLGIGVDKNHRLIASTKLKDPAPRHGITASLLGSRLRVRVDDRLMLNHVVHTRGGFGLGVWRARGTSPTPIFSNLTVTPL